MPNFAASDLHWNSINVVPLNYINYLQSKTFSIFGNSNKIGLLFFNKNIDYSSGVTTCHPQINDGAKEYRSNLNGTLLSDEKLFMQLCDLDRYIIFYSTGKIYKMNFENEGELNIRAKCENEINN